MNAGPTVNLAEAARHSPRSVATLRRWLAAGTIAGAERWVGQLVPACRRCNSQRAARMTNRCRSRPRTSRDW